MTNVHSGYLFHPSVAGPRIIDLVILSDTSNYNMFAQAQVAVGAVLRGPYIVNLTVESGVVVSSTNGLYAISTGVWHEDSKLFLINEGIIIGQGGAGGTCPSSLCGTTGAIAGSSGADGGDAILLQHDLEAINESGGIIGGGGGGGGSGDGYRLSIEGGSGGGGGGGGGLGIAGGPGKTNSCTVSNTGLAGTTGTNTSGGDGGDHSTETGGAGGSAGVAGSVGTAGTREASGGGGGGLGTNGAAGGSNTEFPGADGGAGGLAGKAIEPNSNTLTLTNNGTIYGATT